MCLLLAAAKNTSVFLPPGGGMWIGEVYLLALFVVSIVPHLGIDRATVSFDGVRYNPPPGAKKGKTGTSRGDSEKTLETLTLIGRRAK